jgi:hypothetical protein
MLDGGGQLPAVARNDEERRVAKGLVWRSAVGSTSRGVRVSRRLAFVSDQHSISRILDHLGLRSSQQDKPPPAREVLRVAEAGEGPSATPHRLDRPTAS